MLKRLKKMNPGVSALGMVLAVSTALFLLVSAIGNMSIARMKTVAGNSYDTKARYAAYSGIEYSVMSLTQNNDWAPPANTIVGIPGDDESYFELTVTNNYRGATPINTASGIEVLPGLVVVESMGRSVNGSGAYSIGTVAQLFRGDRRIRYAISTEEEIIIENNSKVDSFYSWNAGGGNVLHYHAYFDPAATPPESSATGYTYSPYAPLLLRNRIAGEAGQFTGTIRTNSVEPGSVTITADSQVYGDVIVGPLGDPISAVTGIPEAPGAVSPGAEQRRIARFRPPYHPETATAPAVVTSDTTITPGSYTSLSVSGGATLTLEVGDYYIDGDFTVNNGNIVMEGTSILPTAYTGPPSSYAGVGGDPHGATTDPTKPSPVTALYVGGNVLLDTANINQEDDRAIPHTFQVLSAGEGAKDSETDFVIRNDSNFRGIVAGRSFNVVLENNSHVDGAIKSRSARVTNNSGVHYDKTLHVVPHQGAVTQAWTVLGMVENEEANDLTGNTGGAAAAAAAAAAPVGGGDAAAAAAAAGDAAGGGHEFPAAGDAGLGDAGTAPGPIPPTNANQFEAPPPGDAGGGDGGGDAGDAGDAGGGDAGAGDAGAGDAGAGDAGAGDAGAGDAGAGDAGAGDAAAGDGFCGDSGPP